LIVVQLNKGYAHVFMPLAGVGVRVAGCRDRRLPPILNLRCGRAELVLFSSADAGTLPDLDHVRDYSYIADVVIES
jgi:hypothetical protein